MSKTLTQRNSPQVFREIQPTATQAGAGSKRGGVSFRNGLAFRETSLGEFLAERKAGKHFDARFQAFVEHVGGGSATDKRTLGILFEIWEEQGRP